MVSSRELKAQQFQMRVSSPRTMAYLNLQPLLKYSRSSRVNHLYGKACVAFLPLDLDLDLGEGRSQAYEHAR